jgi:nucleotide-binding universal stress UspA family protein
MKKILFPTDFSETSNNAFVYALKLANAINASIITLHVYELETVAYLDSSLYLKEIYEYEELSNFENYKGEVPMLRKIAEENNLGHISWSNVLIQGVFYDEVVKIAHEENIDFIVMGTKGAIHLSEIFWGTETTKVMNNTKSIVLAIPEKCKFSPINKILFTTKYNMTDVEALKKVKDFANVFQAHINCLNIKTPHKVYNNDFIVDFKNIFKDQDIDFNSVLSNDVEGEIIKYIDQNNIDILAIHVRHKGFFEKMFNVSLSRKLAFHSKVPIMSIQ